MPPCPALSAKIDSSNIRAGAQKSVTTDALLTQRDIGDYIVGRKAHYHFTVKGNQAGLLEAVQLFFQNRGNPDFVEPPSCDHGRIDTRKIWVTSELNTYLHFPHVGQAFVIERESIHKKTGKISRELAYGIDSRTPDQANPQKILATNRGHWSIENSCHYILDWSYDEDRGRISKGHGPENITRLRRFAISIIQSKKVRNVSQAMRKLSRNTRLVFDYLRMTLGGITSELPAKRHNRAAAKIPCFSVIPNVPKVYPDFSVFFKTTCRIPAESPFNI